MTEKMKIIEALSKVMEDVRSVRKVERNEQQKFLFRGIDAVMNAVGPALRKHGVVIVPEVLEHSIAGSQTSTGKTINVCRVKVQYTFYGPDGDSITATVPGESMDSGDKATAKAMSVAYRTCLLQALTLPTDEADPDQDVYEAPVSKPVVTPWDMGNAENAIRLARGDEGTLRKAWSEAEASGAEQVVLDAIKDAAAPKEQVLEGTVQS